MALWWPCPWPFSPLPHFRRHTAISRPFLSQTLIPTSLTSKNSSGSVSVSRVYRYQSQQITCSSSSSSSSSSDSIESASTSPPTGAFIKGLPESMTEGRLKKAFAQFGEVVQVQIVIEKMSKQPLGSAFVWFTEKESAELAVKEMNGKFFDGRFILVKIAEPGLPKNRGRRKRYKF